MSHLDYDTLEACYAEACSAPSDMHAHCPLLRKLASRCQRVTEFGVRFGVSTMALLAGVHDSGGLLTSYDCAPCERAVARLGELAGGHWRFIEGDSLAVTIGPTQGLFIDTIHTGTHLEAELMRHAGKVSKWIALHDVQEFGETGSNGGEGMLAGLRRFLAADPEWQVVDHRPECHGMTVLARGGAGLGN